MSSLAALFPMPEPFRVRFLWQSQPVFLVPVSGGAVRPAVPVVGGDWRWVELPTDDLVRDCGTWAISLSVLADFGLFDLAYDA